MNSQGCGLLKHVALGKETSPGTGKSQLAKVCLETGFLHSCMCGGGHLRDKPQSFRTFQTGLDQRIHCLPDVDPDSVLSAGLNQEHSVHQADPGLGSFPFP